jgi:ATP-binding cassette, subfamily B, multidrug efflux pump
MKTILKYLKPYQWSIILIFILVATRAVLDLLLPLLLGLLVNEGIGLQNQGTPDFSKIWLYSGLMLGLSLFSILITIWSGYMESSVSSKFAKTLRRDFYQKVQQFSLKEVDELSISSLITRATNDIRQLQMNVNTLLRLIILQPILAIGAVIFSIAQQPSLSMIIIVAVSVLVIMIVIAFIIVLPRFEKVQLLVDRLNLVIRENLSGLRVVRAFNTQTIQQKKIEKAASDSKDLNVFVNRVLTLMFPVMSVIMGATSLAIVYFGYDYFQTVDGFDPGSLLALQQYAMRAIMAFMFLSFTFMMIPRMIISARRVSEVLNQDISIQSPSSPVELQHPLKGHIQFENVTFKYPDAPQAVLEHITFEIKPGQTVAFIGSTGSGKSTLVHLIPRFYDVTKGRILIDGLDIKDMSLDVLHQAIGYVPQQGILFSGTIQDNILFGADLKDDATLKWAASIAQAQPFIEEMEDTYEHHIAQGGKNVSGGQKQRLSIARALAKKAPILIFDDSFSALDYQTDQKLRKELKQVSATKIIVAQRVQTIKDADIIVVLDKGALAGIGNHETLMKTSLVYQEIAASQLSKEELSR